MHHNHDGEQWGGGGGEHLLERYCSIDHTTCTNMHHASRQLDGRGRRVVG